MQELVGLGTLDTSGLSGFLVDVGMQVVVVHVLWVVLSVSCVLLNVEPSIRKVVPSSLRFISKKYVSSIVPFKPSPDSVRKLPCGIAVWSFVEPVILWSFEVVTPGSDVLGELSLESGNDIIERQGVSREVHPSRVGGEDGESLAWPQTIVRMPRCGMRAS